jgi:hypothetical protein
MRAQPTALPACMSQLEYDFWASDPLSRTDSPCRDCTVNWHLARLAEGRCDGTPGGEPERIWEHISPDERRARNRARMARKRVRSPLDLTVSGSYDS